MLGLLDINMRSIECEGQEVCIRHQRKPSQNFDDESVFAWLWNDESLQSNTLLALRLRLSKSSGVIRAVILVDKLPYALGRTQVCHESQLPRVTEFQVFKESS